jgi:type IV pilus assembly protein PilW
MRKSAKDTRGFTLIELLIAMTTGIVVLSGIYAAYNSQQKIYSKDQLIVDAQQEVRAVALFMIREIRLAGMDGKGTAGAGFLVAGPHSIQFTMDRDDDGNVTDPDEDIAYGFSVVADADTNGFADTGAAPIKRFAVGNEDIAEDIHSIGFAYAFDDDEDGELDFVDGNGNGLFDIGEEIWAYDSDADGNLDWDNDTGAALASTVGYDKIRAVQIWILARTRNSLRGYSGSKNFIVGDKVVNVNDNYQYRLLNTTVKCRNMGLNS